LCNVISLMHAGDETLCMFCSKTSKLKESVQIYTKTALNV
jgi:hypothetical protein